MSNVKSSTRFKIIYYPIAIICAVILFRAFTNTSSQKPSAAASESLAAPDPLAEVHKEERRNITQGITKRLQDSGVGGVALDIDGNLLIKTDYLKTQNERDEYIARAFDTKTQHGLCAIGFKTIEVKGESAFASGKKYAVACSVSESDQEAQRAKQLAERREIGAQIQATLRESTHDNLIIATSDTSELIVTGKNLTPSVFAPNFVLTMPQHSIEDWCSKGLKGIRVRDSNISRGVYASFHCNS